MKVPKPTIIWALLIFVLLAVACGWGGPFLCSSIALGLKSAAKFKSRFHTYWWFSGVNLGSNLGLILDIILELISGYLCDIFWTWCPCCPCLGQRHAPNSDRIKTWRDLKRTKRVAQQRYRSHNGNCLCPTSCRWIRKQSVWDWYVHDLFFRVFVHGRTIFFPSHSFVREKTHI